MRLWECLINTLDNLIEIDEFEQYKEDLKKLKDIAEKIDETLLRLYGDEQPNEDKLIQIYYSIKRHLRKKYYKICLIELNLIARSVCLCVACQNSETCEQCEFAKIAGDCNDRDSLYDNFMQILEKITSSYSGIRLPELLELFEIISSKKYSHIF